MDSIYGGNMRKSCIFALLAIAFIVLSGSPARSEHLVIDGTGDSQAVLRKLAALFEEKNQGVTVEVPNSIGSGGGIKAISRHEIELARTARPLKKKERNEDLTEILFARSPVVFVASPGSVVNTVSTQQILDIFSGKIKNWQELGGPDHKIYPVDREQGDSSRKILSKYMPGFKEIQSVGKVFYTTPETAEAIGLHAFTFGFVPLSVALEHKLHILSLNRQVATMKNVKSGTYTLLTPFFLIQSKQSGPLARRFVEFVFSPEARDLMVDNGVYPVASRK